VDIAGTDSVDPTMAKSIKIREGEGVRAMPRRHRPRNSNRSLISPQCYAPETPSIYSRCPERAPRTTAWMPSPLGSIPPHDVRECPGAPRSSMPVLPRVTSDTVSFRKEPERLRQCGSRAEPPVPLPPNIEDLRECQNSCLDEVAAGIRNPLLLLVVLSARSGVPALRHRERKGKEKVHVCEKLWMPAP
jgi:hypothetical protein